jgi:hypothetical protein
MWRDDTDDLGGEPVILHEAMKVPETYLAEL